MGAQGGGTGTKNSGLGGYGGNSFGYVELKKNLNIYINIGGQGNASISKTGGNGGYNGGGNGGTTNESFNANGGNGGGGATHIALISGLLSSLESYKSNILIVSGGGAGAMSWGFCSVGSAGGYVGAIGCYYGEKYQQATQTYGYAFGKGFDGLYKQSHDTGAEGNGGGGGGYYGGYSNGIGNFSNASGGGGSGYIGNPLLTDKIMYCYNCEESREEATKTVSTTCSEEAPTSYCAKKGNGYARITLISVD